MKIVEGIYRIESTFGPRPFSQYLIHGEKTMLIDNGVADTPDAVIIPYLATLGLSPDDLNWVVLSHADVDHFGGSARIKALSPHALFAAHEADQVWIENHATITRERYQRYDQEGFAYPEGVMTWLPSGLGDEVALDITLCGGEHFAFGGDLRLECLHLPGHTPGHIGFWHEASATAIVLDAVMANGLQDETGAIISAPPYFDVAAYRHSAKHLQSLRPERLLTSHYLVYEGAAATQFLADTIAFTDKCRDAVLSVLREKGRVTLQALHPLVNAVMGPFTVMTNEFAGPLEAHLVELVNEGQAILVKPDAPQLWEYAG
jgi:glyoxylase-like metal-dependent hydrolase (beta-lactamase superfamily II)